MSQSTASSVRNATLGYLKRHLGELTALPATGERWTVADVDLSAERIVSLSAKDVIERHDTVQKDDQTYVVWETCDGAWAQLQQLRQGLDVLPCGHRPVRTVDLDSERPYTCRSDDCPARFDRATVEEVFDSEC